ncbi:MAG: hypothetical protein LBK71_02570, partial [Verrucomicrobiales bacterium]|nr:hypothetical protein [Verrucomicrobiales bacterium]
MDFITDKSPIPGTTAIPGAAGRQPPATPRKTGKKPLAVPLTLTLAFLGTLERWNAGTLERWNAGTLERWNAGTLERWNAGTLER